MYRTFRDCCGEAWRTHGSWGVARLWGVVFCDLVVTVSSEQSTAWVKGLCRLFGLEKEYVMNNLLSFDVALRTDIGCTRANNEDNVNSIVPQDLQLLQKKGALFVVADGMGGHEHGEVASKIAVDEVGARYYQGGEDVADALTQAIKYANTLVYKGADDAQKGMGSTCIAAVVQGSAAYIANVGDSRAYIVRDGEVRQISRDHSWVEEQVHAGIITEEQARTHAQRNVITRCLGSQEDVEVDLFIEPVQMGDILVLCTDGLSSLVRNEELREVVETYSSEESVERLIAQAKERGGPDNITALVAKIN
jgi:serine/threonine protein phosphatase PrpC